MDNDEIKYMPIKDLKVEEGVEELMNSPLMQPYDKVAEMLLQKKDASRVIAEIAKLPLEKRYLWRVASALKWGFADFDNLNVAIDRETLSPEDRERVAESIKLRPMQFCIFLKALLGAEEMQRLMIHAIKVAKQVP
jgi:hypothetical protein